MHVRRDLLAKSCLKFNFWTWDYFITQTLYTKRLKALLHVILSWTRFKVQFTLQYKNKYLTNKKKQSCWQKPPTGSEQSMARLWIQSSASTCAPETTVSPWKQLTADWIKAHQEAGHELLGMVPSLAANEKFHRIVLRKNQFLCYIIYK